MFVCLQMIASYTGRNEEDALRLQNDLDEIHEWCQEWLIHLHPDKFDIMKVTNKRKPLKSMHMIDDHVLNEVSSNKCLGITLQSSLSWNIY